MSKVIAKIKLAPGRIGLFDPLTNIYMTLSNPMANVYDHHNTKNLISCLKSKQIIVMEGSLKNEKESVKEVVKPEVKNKKEVVQPEIVKEPEPEPEIIPEPEVIPEPEPELTVEEEPIVAASVAPEEPVVQEEVKPTFKKSRKKKEVEAVAESD